MVILIKEKGKYRRRSSVVEQLIRNQQVVSSILTAGSSKIRHLQSVVGAFSALHPPHCAVIVQ